MRETGAWKPDAQLRNVIAAAAWILRPYKNVDTSEPRLILRILEDFEIIWLEVVSPMFDNQIGLLGLFGRGGNLDKKLLGSELHQKLRDIRTILKEARGQNVRRSGKCILLGKNPMVNASRARSSREFSRNMNMTVAR
jgi:hypothetical protein